ncbi:hypothetical protein M8J76_010039 [Diaphorina citri]|nr:hypothetical protein M8J76_010039 [Diaphorina citri]
MLEKVSSGDKEQEVKGGGEGKRRRKEEEEEVVVEEEVVEEEVVEEKEKKKEKKKKEEKEKEEEKEEEGKRTATENKNKTILQNYCRVAQFYLGYSLEFYTSTYSDVQSSFVPVPVKSSAFSLLLSIHQNKKII